MAFRTSEILPSKNNVEQTDSGLARRQNIGDTKPSFRKPVYHNRFSKNEFSLHRGYLVNNTWWSWREDPFGHDYQAIFCFRLLAFAMQINHPLKTVDHTPHTSLWPSVAYIVIVSPPADAQTPDDFSYHHRDTRDTPIPFRCKTVRK